MATKPLQGWLPVEIGFDRQPAVIREALVRWMEFGPTPLAEPFFEVTIDRLRKAEPPAREIETDLDTMLRVASRFPAIPPAGFIFHISHCGSTLISNALKTSDQVVVASEPGPITNYLLRPLSPAPGPRLNRAWNETRRAVLNALFTLFAQYRTGEPAPLVIKFSSLNILSLPWVRSCWPEVPCVVVIRDPVEVMVACPPKVGWMSFKDHSEFARELFGWADLPRSPGEMTDEEFCARVLGRFLTCAMEAIEQNQGREKCMVVDYAGLDAERVREIAAFFAIEVPADGTGFDLVFGSYAKDPKQTKPFQDDRGLKQKLAGVLVRSAASLWASDSYLKLRKLVRRRE